MTRVIDSSRTHLMCMCHIVPREQETDIKDIMKVENEVKLRDEQRRNAEATFKKYDTNENGTLEPDEIKNALIDLGMNLPDSQMDEYVTNVMKIYDDNNDGFLRLYEFEKLYSTCMASEKVRERYVDKMISGISDEEQMRSLAQHAFDKYDEDKSGTLDIMELAEVLIHLLPLQNSDFNEDQWVDLIKRVYQQNDADGDGHIDFDEFVKLYTKVLASDELKSAFSRGCLLRYNATSRRWGLDGLDVLEAELRY